MHDYISVTIPNSAAFFFFNCPKAYACKTCLSVGGSSLLIRSQDSHSDGICESNPSPTEYFVTST